MNEAIMSALASAVTAATEALEAAQAGDFEEARQLLAIMDDHLEEGQGGNAAHAARRRKVLKLEFEVRALLPDLPTTPPQDTPAESAPTPLPLPAPEQPADPLPAAEVAQDPTTDAAAPSGASSGQEKAPRGVAPPQHLSAEAWVLVGEALRAGGGDPETLEGAASQHEQAQEAARIARDRYRARVEERAALQARVEAAALRGDVDGANRAWDRLFDVVTAIRGAEGKARRGGQPDEGKARDYHAAREDTLKIRRWARGV